MYYVLGNDPDCAGKKVVLTSREFSLLAEAEAYCASMSQSIEPFVVARVPTAPEKEEGDEPQAS